jgi:hypothetical protein
MRKGLFSNITFSALLVPALVLIFATVAISAEEAEQYDEDAARQSETVNPHQQITDEGEILWEACMSCHVAVPDIETVRSIKEASLVSPEDPDLTCRQCHTVKPHPASEGISATMSQMPAPDHLVEPSDEKLLNIRLSKKEVSIILPLHPESGRVICVTCHNPHERGLLRGRADTGGDGFARLRTPGLDICQYCHRK